MVHRIKY